MLKHALANDDWFLTHSKQCLHQRVDQVLANSKQLLADGNQALADGNWILA
jgi:hypothetical protein